MGLEDFLKLNGNLNKAKQASEYILKTSGSKGIPDEDLRKIVDTICSDTTNKGFGSILFSCLIPETKFPNDCLKRLLGLLVSKEPSPLQKLCYEWLLGALRYDLCDQNLVQRYYLKFVYALLNNHKLGDVVIAIIYHLMKPEDVKKFYIELFLEQREAYPSLQWNALLSRMKSYKSLPSLESVVICELHIPKSEFDTGMENAQRRCNEHLGLAELDEFLLNVNIADTSIEELKTLTGMQRDCVSLSIPSQTIHFLSGRSGIYDLAFSDSCEQAKFISTLEATLNAVFLKCTSQYSEREKEQLLQSVGNVQETLQQSILVVNRFLIEYLQLWDGHQCKPAVYKLLQWFIFDTVDEWKEVTPYLQVLFRSSSLEDRRRIIDACTCLLRNMVTTLHKSKLDLPYLLQQDSNCLSSTPAAFQAVAYFVDELLLEALAEKRPAAIRRLLSEALDFYHYVAFAEELTDMQSMIVAPGSVVYSCLFSGSRLIIERLISLLIKYNSPETRERLRRLGIYGDYEPLFKHNETFLADSYRVLLSNLRALSRTNLGVFDETFLRRLDGIDISSRVPAIEALRVDNSFIWWTIENKSEAGGLLDHAAMEKIFPCVLELRKIIEG